MYIKKLAVHNYRSLCKVNLEFGKGRNVLVGKNNSGKSNLIKALDLVMGEKMPNYISFEYKDFYSEKRIVDGQTKIWTADSFFITVELSGTDVNVALLNECKGISLSNEGVAKVAHLSSESNDYIMDNLFTKDTDEFSRGDKSWIDRTGLFSMINESLSLQFYLCVERFDDDTLDEKTKSTFGIIVKKNDGKLYRGWGISKQFRNALLTSAIIPAFRDPQSQFKLNNWSWYGKLIKGIWENKSVELTTGLRSLTEEIRAITNDVFGEATTKLKQDLSEAINHQSINFQLIAGTKDDIYKGINLFVDDGIESLASDKGSGIQSALIIGLFTHYCSQYHTNSSLLAIEEPELYLHPHARRVLSSKFDAFLTPSDDGIILNQVIVATHSPEFLRNTEIENIFVVKKEKDKNHTVVKQINRGSDNKEIQKLRQILWSKNAEMFFADKVILVEGGEEYLLPIIADKYLEKENALDYHNISVIKVGGKSQFKTYIRILKDLNIEFIVLADFDYFTEGLTQIKEYIDSFDQDQYNKLNQTISDIYSEEDTYKKGRDIKKKLHSGEAKELCELIDKMCELQTYDSDIMELWEQFKPKIKKKINMKALVEFEDLYSELTVFVNTLFTKNIKILKNGELEDYIKEEADKYLQEQRVSGKELSILKLVEAILNEGREIDEFFETDEFIGVIVQAVN